VVCGTCHVTFVRVLLLSKQIKYETFNFNVFIKIFTSKF
jgi:hypothetical protein